MLEGHQIFNLTATASAAVHRGYGVDFAGVEITTEGQRPFGIALHDAASGEDYTLAVKGTVFVKLGDDVSQGDELQMDTNGKSIPAVPVSIGIPAGTFAITGLTATPTLTVAGGVLPNFTFGIALTAGTNGNYIEALLVG